MWNSMKLPSEIRPSMRSQPASAGAIFRGRGEEYHLSDAKGNRRG